MKTRTKNITDNYANKKIQLVKNRQAKIISELVFTNKKAIDKINGVASLLQDNKNTIIKGLKSKSEIKLENREDYNVVILCGNKSIKSHDSSFNLIMEFGKNVKHLKYYLILNHFCWVYKRNKITVFADEMIRSINGNNRPRKKDRVDFVRFLKLYSSIKLIKKDNQNIEKKYFLDGKKIPSWSEFKFLDVLKFSNRIVKSRGRKLKSKEKNYVTLDQISVELPSKSKARNFTGFPKNIISINNNKQTSFLLAFNLFIRKSQIGKKGNECANLELKREWFIEKGNLQQTNSNNPKEANVLILNALKILKEDKIIKEYNPQKRINKKISVQFYTASESNYIPPIDEFEKTMILNGKFSKSIKKLEKEELEEKWENEDDLYESDLEEVLGEGIKFDL